MLLLALTLGAVGGVFIAGGVAPPIVKRAPDIAAHSVFLGSILGAISLILILADYLATHLGKGALS